MRAQSFSLRACLVFLFVALVNAIPTLAQLPQPSASPSETKPTQANIALANAFASLLEQVFPREYEKRKDWGNTKNVTVGLRNEGWKIYRRKKPVKHGTWKHYKIGLHNPVGDQSEPPLNIQIKNLRSAEEGRVAFTLVLDAQFDLWARAKVYQYGIHLIALELVGDTAINLELDCEVGVQFQTKTGNAGVALDPKVIDARLDMRRFNLHRVSNAKGPLVHELGEEIPGWIEHELRGSKLTAKLNRAINKKRDRLEVSFGELLR